MSTNLKLRDLIAVERHPSMYFPGASFYPTVVAYLLGAQRADPSVLHGFQEFVSVSHEPTGTVGWPAAILRAWDISPAQLGFQSKGDFGDPEIHKQAIEGLFAELRRFADLVESGGLPDILAQHEVQTQTPPPRSSGT